MTSSSAYGRQAHQFHLFEAMTRHTSSPASPTAKPTVANSPTKVNKSTGHGVASLVSTPRVK